MKDIRQIVTESVRSNRKSYVQEAVNRILGEDVKVGDKVAVIDDVISGLSGSVGKIKSISSNNPGFAAVSLENGTEFQMQTSLLIPV